METPLTNVGLIQCTGQTMQSLLNGNTEMNQFNIKKVYYKNGASSSLANRHYPFAEVVADKQSIIADDSIDLVVLTAPGNEDMDLAGEALQAGKNVRIL